MNRQQTHGADNNPELTDFMAELEAMHRWVWVYTGVRRAPDLFTLKLRTPLRAYFDTDTRNGWRSLVKRDLEAVGTIQCPFCQTVYPNSVGGCGTCDAETDFVLGELLDRYPPDLFSAQQALWLLAHFDEHFRLDDVRQLAWARLSEPVTELPLLATHQDPVHYAPTWARPAQIPVLIAAEHLDKKELALARQAGSIDELKKALKDHTDALVTPTCEHCTYALSIREVDGGTTRLCARPMHGFALQEALEQALAPGGLAFKPETLQGETRPLAVIWNVFLARLFWHLTPIDDPAPLQGRYSAPYHTTGGPICAAFTLRTDDPAMAAFAPLDVKTSVEFETAQH